MQLLSLVMVWFLSLAGGELAPRVDCGDQAVLNADQHAGFLLLRLADDLSPADGLAGCTAGILGDEEDSESRNLFDMGEFGVAMRVTPGPLAVDVDSQPRDCRLVACPIPLRC